jgi:tetratricopeptide (TPR) repeat protein
MTTGHPTELDFSDKNFLIIDDFQGMLNMLRDIVRGCGGNLSAIETATNGKKAISLLERGKFDVVLCDFNLGAGKNGQHILEEAKYRELIGPACVWIMITAEKTPDVVTGTAEYLPDAYLIKPITEATLRMRLVKIWAKKQAFSEIDAAMARHDHGLAIRLCDERLAVDKANAADLQRLRCQLLLASGELDLARQGYAEVLGVRDTPWAKAGMARVLYQSGDFAEAKLLLEEVIGDNVAFLEAHDLLAKTLQATGEVEAAEEILERATRLSPNSVLRQKSLGDIALKLGKLDNAERAFRKSVALGENSVLKTPDAYLGLAKACSAKQNPEEALRVLGNLNKTFDREDVRLKSLAVEGLVHHQSGNLALASKAAKELGERMTASDIRPDSETAMEVARLLLATGDREKAMTLLQGEVKNSPDNTALLAEVQEVFNTANMGEEGARFVESSRQEAIDMMNRGALLARDGKLEEAILWMRNARQTMPSNVRVLFNLAQVILTRMNQLGIDADLAAEARDCLTTANRIAPGDRRFGLIMGALDKLASNGKA